MSHNEGGRVGFFSLNPLKTRKSFRLTSCIAAVSTGKRGLNPLKTRKSFRQNKIFHRYGYYWCLNPLKTRKSFRRSSFNSVILAMVLS